MAKGGYRAGHTGSLRRQPSSHSARRSFTQGLLSPSVFPASTPSPTQAWWPPRPGLTSKKLGGTWARLSPSDPCPQPLASKAPIISVSHKVHIEEKVQKSTLASRYAAHLGLWVSVPLPTSRNTRWLDLVPPRASLPDLRVPVGSAQNSPVSPSSRMGRREPRASPGTAGMAAGSQRPWSVPAPAPDVALPEPRRHCLVSRQPGQARISQTPSHPQPGAV